jgi:hypothetical protein
MSTDTPVLDTIADITAASIDHASGTAREFMLARVAALIAVDAPPASYLAHAPAVMEAGITADDVQSVMIAIAPVVGTPRVVSAAGHIMRALGFAIAVGEAEAGQAGQAGQPGQGGQVPGQQGPVMR